MNKAFYLLLGSIVLLSGCVIPGFSGGDVNKATQGLIIKTWEPELVDSQVFLPNQPISFSLVLENIGSSEAKNIKVKTSSELGLDQCVVKELVLPGNQYDCFLSGKVPAIPSGLKTEKKSLVTVTYEYLTEAAKTINVRSLEEARLIKDSGRSLTLTDYTTPKNSPLDISIEAKTPVTVFETEGRFLSPILITVRNTGGGVVCYPNCENSNNRNNFSYELSNNRNKFSYKLEIIGDGVRFSQDRCLSPGSIHTLEKGDSYTIPCTAIESTKPQFETTPIIKVTTEYGYETQAEASITIDNTDTL